MAAVFGLVGCAGGHAAAPLSGPSASEPAVTPGTAAGVVTPDAAPTRDIEAVLAMAGTFAVSYRHAESAALAPGRALAEPYTADARESVRVVEQTPGRVSLQHLLLIGEAPLVVKHWREDWEHAAPQRLVYDGPVPGGGRWSVQAVSSEAGTWTRTVYAADDAPGYAAAGRWTHRGGVSEWEADAPAVAPVARHEADRSADDADGGDRAAWGQVHDRVVVQQGGGWTREESVVKLDAAGTPLAREHGVIRYVRRGDTPPPQVTEYWQRVGGFWQTVRAGWAQRLPVGSVCVVRDRLADGPRWRAVFGLADAPPQATDAQRASRLDAVLDAAVTAVE